MPRIPRQPLLWAGNDEAGDLSQPRTFGAAESATEIGADFPDASAEHATLLQHTIGWLVAMAVWVIGIYAAQSIVDWRGYSTGWTMLHGAVWAVFCVAMKRATVHTLAHW